ncbi:HlyD family secretion protein [Nitrosospira sp. Nsp5]|uniref:HlyD family secretion protein n=1 Tax=Nitrosospira multiformis TaxID=1231 RepID=A0ABY0TEY4_9PROT|nr:MULTISPECIES: HlyD family efflux transporter periplasmic adaptor subunit [Nitrosospira]PTR09173.1 HlyD family secretion protein [Nitrosospira sp. Nsp5]SDQ72598.1 HlyD family secretion protein [Nitrosospira multiformis]
MNKRRIVVAIMLAVAVVTLASWSFFRQESDTNTLELFGNVDIRQVSLAFNGSERIAEMRVQEGDRVEAGQVLATLDTRTLALQIAQAQAGIEVQEQVLLRLKNGTRPEEVDQAKADVASAQAEADLAGQQLKRLQNVEKTAGEAISQQDLDHARSRRQVFKALLKNRKKALKLAVIGPRKEDIAQAEAQLNVSKAELALLKHQLSLAELKAPINAVVRSRLLEPGDMASPQRPVYALAITDPKWVRAYVTEVDLGRIKPGMSARVTTDSHPDQSIRGHVGYISSVAEFTPKMVQTEELRTSLVYEVRVFVEDAEDRLRLGMPATVRIFLENHRDVAGAAQ